MFVNYSLSAPASVSIELFDVLGGKLQRIVGELDAGVHQTVIDVQNLPNGIYTLQIRANDQTKIKKIVVVK